MNNLVAQIQEFDNSNLSLSEIFDKQKSIFEEIHAHSAFGDISLADGQTLKNMLDGIVKNKIAAFENSIVQPKQTSNTSIQEIFVQKIANSVQNTAESTPFYNIF